MKTNFFLFILIFNLTIILAASLTKSYEFILFSQESLLYNIKILGIILIIIFYYQFNWFLGFLFDIKENLLLTEQKDIDSTSEVFKKPLLPKRKRNDSEFESTTDMPSKKQKDSIQESSDISDDNDSDPDNDPKEVLKDLVTDLRKVRSGIAWEKNTPEKVKQQHGNKLLEETKEQYSSWFDEESDNNTNLESLQQIENYLMNEIKSVNKEIKKKTKKMIQMREKVDQVH